jgi:hypothetical protein
MRARTPIPKLVAFPEPDFDTAPVLRIIEQLKWRQARKTNKLGKPQTPHAYALRDRVPEDLFIALFDFIQQHGREERYARAKRQYLYPGDGFKYWSMTPDLAESTIINRMLVSDDLDRLRATKQIE